MWRALGVRVKVRVSAWVRAWLRTGAWMKLWMMSTRMEGRLCFTGLRGSLVMGRGEGGSGVIVG
jgi:hypothetical protein